MSATVVVVPGAWHGAWSFDRVVPLVRDAGVEIVAVDLPGRGEDPGPLTDLHGDAERVREVLDGIDGDVVLVGHSYGGAVVTEAGVAPNVRQLVYLAALNLDEGESAGSAAAAEVKAANLSHEGRPNLGKSFVVTDGVITLEPQGAAECLYNDCDGATIEWALARLSGHPMANLGQSPNAIAWREKPSTYVVCEQDLTVHPGMQEILATRANEMVRWPTSHSPFASQPELVADFLVGLANA